MKKSEIQSTTDTQLFALFGLYTEKLVKEANSIGGETKKTTKTYNLIVDECIKRFNLDRQVLINEFVILD